MDIDQHIRTIQSMKNLLSSYHGSLLLKNIPELTDKDLLAVLGSSYDHLTVKETQQKLANILSAESVFLQFKKFQEEFRKGTIITGVQRLPENKRQELLKNYRGYELLQIAFSLPEHYFHINPRAFRKGDKEYNRQLFLTAMDTMIIDPEKVPQSSLDALDVKQLDPDCQNLKDILKEMRPLTYQAVDKMKYTPTINTYRGKLITFSSQSVNYPASQPATAGEKRKEDVRVQMAVYPDLFSLIRREWHILESLEDKKISYKAIKNKLISIINEIDRNQKCYGASVRNQVDGIIKEIDAATSAKVVAQKIYHLYAVHGKHSEQDKKRLRAAVRQFTMRISQIIGIASNVQLHSLTLEDVLEDQQSELEMFHAKVKGAIPYGETISLSEYEKFLFAFENYFTYKSEYLKEPFRTFDAQISRVFGTVEDMRKQNAELVMKKADLIISLQRRFLDAYILEHTYKEGLLSVGDICTHIPALSDTDLHVRYPAIYHNFFADIDAKRNEFSPNFSYAEITDFFAELTDMRLLEKKIEMLLQHI